MVDMKGACFTTAKRKTGRDDWETPIELYNWLDKQYHFTLDPCASYENHKCDKYYTIETDGLSQSWKGETFFCNPPYSMAKEWVKKAFEESKNPGTSGWILIPSRTDTILFHEYVMKSNTICFIKGRLKFVGAKSIAPFPSMLVYFSYYISDLCNPEIITLERKEFIK